MDINTRILVTLDRMLEAHAYVIQASATGGDEPQADKAKTFATIDDAKRDISEKVEKFLAALRSKRSYYSDFITMEAPIPAYLYGGGVFEQYFHGGDTDEIKNKNIAFMICVKDLICKYLLEGELSVAYIQARTAKVGIANADCPSLTTDITNYCNNFFQSLKLNKYAFDVAELKAHVEDSLLYTAYGLNFSKGTPIHAKFWIMAGAP